MDNTARLAIYQAQCTNVRALKKARGQLRRAINKAIRKNDEPAIEAYTKALALLFCAWVEASFSKLIHTPHGLALSEISQVKQSVREGSVETGWRTCITLALRKNNAKKSNFSPNAKQKISGFVEKYIRDPSQIRNKIAHGQWVLALNRHNTDLNNDLTTQIKNFDSVVIERCFLCCEKLIAVVEHLIESPNRHFMQSYWNLVAELEEIEENRGNWTVATKAAAIQAT